MEDKSSKDSDDFEIEDLEKQSEEGSKKLGRLKKKKEQVLR